MDEQRRPSAQYLFNPNGEKPEPLDAELLAWLVDQLCSDIRVHPDRTMSIGFITNQAVYEFPAVYDALAERDAEIAALNGTIRSLQIDLQAHKDALAQWEGNHDPE